MTLDDAIADHERRGYRLDMIMPADAPRIAVVSKGAEMLHLTATATGVEAAPFTGIGHPVIPPGRQEFILTRANETPWVAGRAGMQYRDLIPGRLGGRYIASHIRVENGGPVPDYVHHHRVRFQMIFVRKGWVRVVYEDQGDPFMMHEGDCVLQPPHIRHRVLESSPGLEVIEVGCPAEHETFRDHELTLPTSTRDPNRNFNGQRFVFHQVASASWQESDGGTFRDTAIAAATTNLAGVRVIRSTAPVRRTLSGDFFFLAILKGSTQLQSQAVGTHTLTDGDACVLPKGADYALAESNACEVLEVSLPALTPAA